MTNQEINEAIAKLLPFLKHKDICNDLNAMWDAEDTLHGLDWEDYFRLIQKKGNGTGTHATARQRAEAFLRVNGLLKD